MAESGHLRLVAANQEAAYEEGDFFTTEAEVSSTASVPKQPNKTVRAKMTAKYNECILFIR